MIGFTGQYKTSKTKTEKCTYSVQGGVNCQIIQTEKNSDRSRNFFDLLDILNDWTLLYVAQRTIQLVLPYSYIALLEVASALAVSLVAVICV